MTLNTDRNGCRACRALRRRLQRVARSLGVDSDDPREDMLEAAVLRLRQRAQQLEAERDRYAAQIGIGKALADELSASCAPPEDEQHELKRDANGR